MGLYPRWLWIEVMPLVPLVPLTPLALNEVNDMVNENSSSLLLPPLVTRRHAKYPWSASPYYLSHCEVFTLDLR